MPAISLDKLEWYYRDCEDTAFGPFSNEAMKEWYQHGHFGQDKKTGQLKRDLPVKIQTLPLSSDGDSLQMIGWIVLADA